MNATLVTSRGLPLLVTRPNLQQYGHLGLEILMSLAYARRADAGVCFVRPARSVCDALFDLRSERVPIVEPIGWQRRAIDWRWKATDLAARTEAWRDECVQVIRQLLCLEFERRARDKGLTRNFRLRLNEWASAMRRWGQEEQYHRDRQKVLTLYYRRRLIRERVPVCLRADAACEAAEGAERLGIGRDAKIVTLHVREAGFKLGREIQERKLGARDDSARNSRIESYSLAVDYLLGLGYTVVRIGDPTMTPVRHPGIVDLATSPDRSPLVELYCLLRSDFLVCGEAGPAAVSYLTNTPCLTVNATDPISSYPIRSDGVFILKGVVERETDRRLSLDEMLSREYLENLRNTTKYRYVDNSSEDIRDAVVEMIEGIRHGWQDTPAQAGFRERVVQAGEDLRWVLTYVRKWGVDDGFIGDGRLGRTFAERSLVDGAAA